MAEKKARKPKTQPTKYDHVGLKAEFVAGDSDNIAQFFKARKIPLKTGYRMSQGWVEERRAIVQKGIQLFESKKAKQIAEALEFQMTIGAGLIKKGADALWPSGTGPDGKPVAGLAPVTAKEAGSLIQAGATIQRNAVTAMGIGTPGVHQVPLNPDQPVGIGGPTLVQVLIQLPPNGKELKA